MLRTVSTRLSCISCGGGISLLRKPVCLPHWTPTTTNFESPEQRRGKSYYASDLEGPPELYTDFEKSYAEWKWVERMIPPKTVPLRPATPGKVFPSGWTVPNPPKNCSYYIPRNKNHMVPVYTLTWDRGQIRETRIKFVEGNIWALERDVGKFLKSIFPYRIISTYTQECARFVGIKGDHTEQVKEWLIKRGF
ncbi:39S ribosomal protein L49, mitochondrial [Folsomia candida]|uniref:Large ribosomal subunit protein mL49 n=1 Tax=Folsomia candida TaxID=158441 RepID=A0A226EGD9_FOLCA|nr:39S ribosomal protein L49, mitochondrial [Folsomia candida]OXA56134.1 hypothetical protein Fcan01_09258 [Folsomia candida]